MNIDTNVATPSLSSSQWKRPKAKLEKRRRHVADTITSDGGGLSPSGRSPGAPCSAEQLVWQPWGVLAHSS
jgi:hypothetical protein